jgi:hypothetical protein
VDLSIDDIVREFVLGARGRAAWAPVDEFRLRDLLQRHAQALTAQRQAACEKEKETTADDENEACASLVDLTIVDAQLLVSPVATVTALAAAIRARRASG